MLKNLQPYSERRKRLLNQQSKWYSSIWLKSATTLLNNGNDLLKVTTKIWRTMKTLKPPDLEWEPLIDWSTLSEKSKYYQSCPLPLKNYCTTMTGDTSILQLWHSLKLENTLKMLKKYHQFCRWSWPSSGTKIPWCDMLPATLLDKFLTICNQDSKKNTAMTSSLSCYFYSKMTQFLELYLTQLLPSLISLKAWNLNRWLDNSNLWSIFCFIMLSTEFPSSKKALSQLFLQLYKLPRKNTSPTFTRLFKSFSASTQLRNTNQRSTNSWKDSLLRLWPSSLAQWVQKCSSLQLSIWSNSWFSSRAHSLSKLIPRKPTFWPDGKDCAWCTEKTWLHTWTRYYQVYSCLWRKLFRKRSLWWTDLLRKMNKWKQTTKTSTLMRQRKQKLLSPCSTYSSNSWKNSTTPMSKKQSICFAQSSSSIRTRMSRKRPANVCLTSFPQSKQKILL